MCDESDKRQELAAVEAAVVRATEALRRLEGRADGLRAELLDLEGAHDRRPVAVR